MPYANGALPSGLLHDNRQSQTLENRKLLFGILDFVLIRRLVPGRCAACVCLGGDVSRSCPRFGKQFDGHEHDGHNRQSKEVRSKPERLRR